MDARHHPFDVITGSMLGAAVAWAAYRQYFPPISETWQKGRAYPVRSWGQPLKRPPGRGVQFEEVAEPLRSGGSQPSGADEEHAATSGEASGRNVFREQIRQTQRRRETEQGISGAHRQRDNWSETSSESERDGEDYEMQPHYTLTDPEGGTSSLMDGVEGGDTSYQSRARQPEDSQDSRSPALPPIAGGGDNPNRY
jgi:diacylglycerol diphosphate phosphatase / phosphatidate phosphatase